MESFWGSFEGFLLRFLLRARGLGSKFRILEPWKAQAQKAYGKHTIPASQVSALEVVAGVLA